MVQDKVTQSATEITPWKWEGRWNVAQF